MSAPLVSVCIRAYDAQAYVGEAIASVLGQQLRDFELIVLDDGSTDATESVVRAFDDPRLRFVRSEHAGLSAATRRCVDLARGTYLAIMDADDVADARRLGEQVARFERDPGLVVVGTDLEIIDGEGRTLGYRMYPRTDAQIRRALPAYNPFGHPSVMFAAEALRRSGSYSTRFETVEDYELYFRLLRLGRGANVPLPLLRYRVHAGSVKATKLKRQLRETIALRRTAVRDYGWSTTPATTALDLAQRTLLALPSPLVDRAFRRTFYRTRHAP